MVAALIGTACGGASATEGGSTTTMRIVAPADGATVSQPFTVRVDAGVPLGDPSTGEDHVHLCFDGGDCDTEYTLVYGNSIPVSGLSPGRHTIEASLRNADHSPAGASTSITVVVSGGGTATGSVGADTPGPSGSGGGRGYGY
jgi:hypothetical protein